ncbi:MAG: hypothetical protein R2825_08020 [Saprospiraceae bacterium]
MAISPQPGNLPLPTRWVYKNKIRDILFERTPIAEANSAIKFPANLTDGDLNNLSSITATQGQRTFSFPIKGNKLFSISLKCQTKTAVKIVANLVTGENENIGIYTSENNYQLIRFEKELNNIKSVKLICENDFDIFEIAALASLPKESIEFKFPKPQKIGVVISRCWAGDNAAQSTSIFTSNDGENWVEAADLNPDVSPEQIISFEERTATYLKLEYTLFPKDWNKVFCWEIKAYDKYGPYGKRPVANTGGVSIKDLLGVNGYWSWGTDKYSSLLGKDAGPHLYARVASHARNYHDLTWDVETPDQAVDFSKMKTQGTKPKEWLDWDREYQEWIDAGMQVQASLQFYRFKPTDWKTPKESAFQYAHSFVKHFGQKNGNGLVCTIEIGNEPWTYPADIYQQILSGMLHGAKDADSTIEVLPCALQAADPDTEETDIFKNYIGARVTQEMAAKLDGVNVHAYSYITDYDGVRKAVHPEHPLSTFWEINNMVRWRDQNMPGKKIYLSEWGWDGAGGGEDCTHQECVSENAAAAYAVRGALIASRLGIERATWFFYGNAKTDSQLYARSGLTSSIEHGFQKKKAFYNLEALKKNAGEGYFLKIIKEDENAWAYLYGDKNGRPIYLIAWLPKESEEEITKAFNLKIPYQFSEAIKLNGSSENGEKISLPKNIQSGIYQLSLSTFPTIFFIEN